LVYLLCEAALICSILVGAVHSFVETAAERKAAAPLPGAAGTAATACLGLAGLMGLLAMTLLLFQCYLIGRGETTWEHLRRERLNAAEQLPPTFRPYDRGNAALNCVAFLLGEASKMRSWSAMAPNLSAMPNVRVALASQLESQATIGAGQGVCVECADASSESLSKAGGGTSVVDHQ
jgi:hypothetical protein